MTTIALSDLETAVLDRTGYLSTDSLLTTAVLDRFINRALFAFSLGGDWPWLYVNETKALSTATFTPTSGWRRTVDLVHQDTGEPLVRRAVRVLDQIPATITGRPSLYAISGGVVNVRVVPDGPYNLTHRYIRTEPPVASGNVLTPWEQSDPIVHLAAAKAFTLKKDMVRAQEAKVDYATALRRIKDDINQGRELLRVEVRPGSAF